MIDILQSYYTYADGVAAESGFLSDITTGGATLLMVIIGVVGPDYTADALQIPLKNHVTDFYANP